MGFCNDITPTCDVCFEVLYGECNDVLTISLGLTPSTTFFLNLTDKFDIVTPLTVTTDGSGDFTITQTWTEFFGDVELEIFSDSGRTLIATFVQDSTVYNCVLLVQELSGSNDIVFPSVYLNQFSLKGDGVDELIQMDAVVASLTTTTQGTWSKWIQGDVGLPDGRIISFGDTNASSRIALQSNDAGKLQMTVRNAGVTQWDLRTINVVLVAGSYIHFLMVMDGIEARIFINLIEVPQFFGTSFNKTQWFNNIPGLDNGRMFCLNQNNAGNTNFWTGNLDESLFTSDAKDSTGRSNIFNGGNPKDESTVPNGVSYFRMGDKSAFDGTNFTLADQIGTNNAKSNNMAFSAKVSDTP